MILVDANILLYAEDSLSDRHESARQWWDEQLSSSAPVCLCWPVLNAFLRIGTNARLHQRPLTLREACQRAVPQRYPAPSGVQSAGMKFGASGSPPPIPTAGPRR